MLLHNQRGAPLSWEANGTVYGWEPYGACELPDELVPLIKSEGFPVSVTPVAPKERANRAAEQAAEAEASVALEQARKELALVATRLQDAVAVAEASDVRASKARAEADESLAKVRALEEEARSLRKDAAEYERLLAGAAAEIAKLKEQLKTETAKGGSPKSKEK
jgi:hypothetical protein